MPVAVLLSSRLSVWLSGESLKTPDLMGIFSPLTTMTTDFYKKEEKENRASPDRVLRFSDVRCQDFVVSLSFVGLFLQEVSHMEQAATKTKAAQTSPAGTFSMKLGKTTYVVGVHFSQTAKDTLEDKMKRLMKDDVKSSNF